MKNFWKNLPVPFTVLAPLDGVTDVVFRQMVTTRLGKPDVLFTEFTSCEGLQSKGRERVLENLAFKPNEQPIVAQLWGKVPENFYKSAQLARRLGFSGVDINMGCPDKTVVKGGACSALIKNPKLAAEIIAATKKGAGDLPVSVKTRIGFDKTDVNDWISFLLEQNLAALTVHLRTVKELSQVPAHWEHMDPIVALRDKIAKDTLLIGNGDIARLEEIYEKHKEYRCEGFMVGRGIFANPWMFSKKVTMKDISAGERFSTFLDHIEMYKKTWGDTKNFANLKKFCKTYINNFSDASLYREQIMETKTLEELVTTVCNLKITQSTYNKR